ncbi:MAG: rhodanese-like domain-containing protein [Rhodobacteraceae bacterium]|nr:rhodanese-like domain-containing protein [Paracoccaceae bacterium]
MEELRPREVWDRLRSTPAAALIDVRSRPEWTFVGLPDLQSIDRPLVLVEWRQYPEMTINHGFVDEVRGALGTSRPDTIFFLCRSGSRSRDAAHHFEEVAAGTDHPVRCFNVLEGFEGDIDADGHRGTLNGWKQSGLPWKQS